MLRTGSQAAGASDHHLLPAPWTGATPPPRPSARAWRGERRRGCGEAPRELRASARKAKERRAQGTNMHLEGAPVMPALAKAPGWDPPRGRRGWDGTRGRLACQGSRAAHSLNDWPFLFSAADGRGRPVPPGHRKGTVSSLGPSCGQCGTRAPQACGSFTRAWVRPSLPSPSPLPPTGKQAPPASRSPRVTQHPHRCTTPTSRPRSKEPQVHPERQSPGRRRADAKSQPSCRPPVLPHLLAPPGCSARAPTAAGGGQRCPGWEQRQTWGRGGAHGCPELPLLSGTPGRRRAHPPSARQVPALKLDTRPSGGRAAPGEAPQ